MTTAIETARNFANLMETAAFKAWANSATYTEEEPEMGFMYPEATGWFVFSDDCTIGVVGGKLVVDVEGRQASFDGFNAACHHLWNETSEWRAA